METCGRRNACITCRHGTPSLYRYSKKLHLRYWPCEWNNWLARQSAEICYMSSLIFWFYSSFSPVSLHIQWDIIGVEYKQWLVETSKKEGSVLWSVEVCSSVEVHRGCGVHSIVRVTEWAMEALHKGPPLAITWLACIWTWRWEHYVPLKYLNICIGKHSMICRRWLVS